MTSILNKKYNELPTDKDDQHKWTHDIREEDLIISSNKIEEIKTILNKENLTHDDLNDLKTLSELLFAKIEEVDINEPLIFEKLQFMKQTIDFLKSVFRVPELQLDIVMKNKAEIEKILIAINDILKINITEENKETLLSLDLKDLKGSSTNLDDNYNSSSLQNLFKLSFIQKRFLLFGQKINPILSVVTKKEEPKKEKRAVEEVSIEIETFWDFLKANRIIISCLICIVLIITLILIL